MPTHHSPAPLEHVDVLIVGAGISGIGMACHLVMKSPSRSFAILEGRGDLGGTWDLFRYPGIRSDSDMYTLGYEFRPWRESKAIADGPSILRYLHETAAEYAVDRKIRFHHRVTRAEWSSAEARWTVTVERADTGETLTLSCGFLFMGAGYYSYRAGHSPDFPGRERFRGTVVHPQAWPRDLDYTGKRVAVIGSGATAMTLVPAMADTAQHVTMVQRSPTYVFSLPDVDVVARVLGKVLPERLAYQLVRFKNIKIQEFLYERCQRAPAQMKEWLINRVRRALPPGYDVDRHFAPRYDPWDQRLCIVPNGDLYRAINAGKVSVVTEAIAAWDETGVQLESGARVDADIIVTATGLELVALGQVDFVVDGLPVDFSKAWTYRGVAYSDVPNMVSSFGYINASWTLRADLIARYVCRLLDWMDRTGTQICTPRLRDSDRSMTPRPFVANFSSGYVQRAVGRLPRQGDRDPWTNPQMYWGERKVFRKTPVDDGVMRFTHATGARPRVPTEATV